MKTSLSGARSESGMNFHAVYGVADGDEPQSLVEKVTSIYRKLVADGVDREKAHKYAMKWMEEAWAGHRYVYRTEYGDAYKALGVLNTLCSWIFQDWERILIQPGLAPKNEVYGGKTVGFVTHEKNMICLIHPSAAVTFHEFCHALINQGRIKGAATYEEREEICERFERDFMEHFAPYEDDEVLCNKYLSVFRNYL